MAPAPIAVDSIDESFSNVSLKGQNGSSERTQSLYHTQGPIKPTGILDQYEHFDLTPVIGREFPDANLVDWINSPNADELLKELAVTISRRGVVFFRKQDNLTNELQKALIHRLGQLSGKPTDSTLHIHPVLNAEGDVGEQRDADQNISTISSKLFKKVYGYGGEDTVCDKKQSSDGWHSDIAFEPAPADYTSLRLTQLPPTGGDTMWASGYEIYDRLSPLWQSFVSQLTCTFAQPNFNKAAERGGFQLYDKPRGSPLNTGSVLKAVHPVVRTNPVTGWRSIFPIGAHISHINGFTRNESENLLKWFRKLLVDNHDLQVRFKWKSENDIAIWDNRSTFHNATYDFEGLGDRSGNRAVGIGERPFLDEKSVSRREGLEAEGEVVGRPFMSRN